MMLKLGGVSCGYGNVQVLWDISLEVRDREIVTIIGPNGAGKTTILRTISGLMKPSAGTIEFDGKVISGVPAHKIVDMGISQIPGGRRLFPLMTVMENLDLGGYRWRKTPTFDEALVEVFQLFPRLEERKDQQAGSLSGGEQQMLAIGRGLMSRPKYLLLDEPSLGLAPLIIKEIGNIITTIRQRGTTILLVEQNANLALKLSDRGYVLETGRIVLHDEGKNLRDNPMVKKSYLGESTVEGA